MKRMWISLVILVLLVAVCSIGFYNTKRISSYMLKTVTQARNAEIDGDTPKAVSLSEKAEQDFRADHEILCLYMPHARLEAIDQTISGLPMLCRYGAKEQFLADCDRSITQLSYLTETEIPSLANIF